jgi:hypothetical protein
MNATFRRTLAALVSTGVLVAAGCSGTTTIKSDLVLDINAGARIELHQQTQAVELVNESVTEVSILVLGKKERVISRMRLNAFDQARLDLVGALALQFENTGHEQAIIRWTLLNDDTIEYSLAMTPASP